MLFPLFDGGEGAARADGPTSSHPDSEPQADHPLEESANSSTGGFCLLEHDQAIGVFRSPRPSIMLSEIQRRQVVKDLAQDSDALVEKGIWLDGHLEVASTHSSDALRDEVAEGDVNVRGGLYNGSPWADLWLAQEQDLGAEESSVFDESTTEARNAWEEAVLKKHDDEEWHALEEVDLESPMVNTEKGRFEEENGWEDEDVFTDLVVEEAGEDSDDDE